MSDFPAPLTPPDCDLRDFAFMPLDVVRLRDSDLAIQADGEAFRCAVLLWCASWHQVPAASLPDDDRTLASLAGFGRAVGEWEKHRDGALRGWIKCSDGRLYHPVVAEKANESWLAKHAHSHRKLLERLRKKGVPREEMPTFDAWYSAGMPKDWPPISEESINSSAGKDLSSAGNASTFLRNGETVEVPAPTEEGDTGKGNTGQSNNKPDENQNSGGKGESSAGKDGEFRRKDSEIPAENSLKGQGQGQGQGQVKKEKKNPLSGGPDEMPTGFTEFWAAWPRGERKAAKAECLKRWKAKGLEAEAAVIVSAVNAQKVTKKWLDGYDPAPLTFLNQRRWLDDVADTNANGIGADGGAERGNDDPRFRGAK